jgi:hypothetical protein
MSYDCHCEERIDEAIPNNIWIASSRFTGFAMTFIGKEIFFCILF